VLLENSTLLASTAVSVHRDDCKHAACSRHEANLMLPCIAFFLLLFLDTVLAAMASTLQSLRNKRRWHAP
jgi:hypothetical protein